MAIYIAKPIFYLRHCHKKQVLYPGTINYIYLRANNSDNCYDKARGLVDIIIKAASVTRDNKYIPCFCGFYDIIPALAKSHDDGTVILRDEYYLSLIGLKRKVCDKKQYSIYNYNLTVSEYSTFIASVVYYYVDQNKKYSKYSRYRGVVEHVIVKVKDAPNRGVVYNKCIKVARKKHNTKYRINNKYIGKCVFLGIVDIDIAEDRLYDYDTVIIRSYYKKKSNYMKLVRSRNDLSIFKVL